MIINELHIPEGFKGLQRSSLKGLSNVVLLAGPNGGGKSRVLDAMRIHDSPMGPGERPSHRRLTLVEREAEHARLEKRINEPFYGPAGGPGSEEHVRSEHRDLSQRVEQLRELVDSEPHIEPPSVQVLIADLKVTRIDFENVRGASPGAWDTALKAVRQGFNVESAIRHGPSAVYGILSNWVSSFNPALVDFHAKLTQGFQPKLTHPRFS